MDPRFAQRNPRIAQIHALCPTYTLNIVNIAHDNNLHNILYIIMYIVNVHVHVYGTWYIRNIIEYMYVKPQSCKHISLKYMYVDVANRVSRIEQALGLLFHIRR